MNGALPNSFNTCCTSHSRLDQVKVNEPPHTHRPPSSSGYWTTELKLTKNDFMTIAPNLKQLPQKCTQARNASEKTRNWFQIDTHTVRWPLWLSSFGVNQFAFISDPANLLARSLPPVEKCHSTGGDDGATPARQSISVGGWVGCNHASFDCCWRSKGGSDCSRRGSVSTEKKSRKISHLCGIGILLLEAKLTGPAGSKVRNWKKVSGGIEGLGEWVWEEKCTGKLNDSTRQKVIQSDDTHIEAGELNSQWSGFFFPFIFFCPLCGLFGWWNRRKVSNGIFYSHIYTISFISILFTSNI